MRSLALFLALTVTACDGEATKAGDDDDDDAVSETDADGDGVDDDDDCEPDDDTIFPGADEVPYDGIDQDCTGTDLTDVDNDGHEAEEVGGDDCDDTNGTISPTRSEKPYDGIDQNCDGKDLTDVDKDGFEAEQVGGEDCDDDNALINPNRMEVPYDGKDQDCDGFDLTDVDEDGYDGGASGDDCDDDDEDVNPGATEICANGVDDDCDGGVGSCGGFVDAALDTTAIALSDDSTLSYSDDFGMSLAAGDLDDDGIDDLVVGVPGREEAYIFFGPITSAADLDPANPDVIIQADTSSDLGGYDIAVVPDLNADGVADLIVGEPGSEGPDLSGTFPQDSGAAYLLTSPFSGTITLDATDAAAVYWGPGNEDYAGFAVDSAGDFDGDTIPDLLIGAPDLDGTGGGRAYVVSGTVTGEVDLDVGSIVELVGTQTPNSSFRPNGDAGLRVAAAGDVNSDGFDDVWVAEPGTVQSSCANCKAGIVRLVHGGDTVTGTLGLGSADVSFEATIDIGEVGTGLAGNVDLNGDGHLDVAMGAPDSYTDPTRVYVMFGPFTPGHTDLDPNADLILEGEAPGAGQSVAVAGDTDGDGTIELLVADPYYDDPVTGFEHVGKVYVVNGPWTSGTHLLADSPSVIGSVEDQNLGGSNVYKEYPSPLVGLGDQNNDGFDDIAIAAPDNNLVFVFAGGAGW